MSEIVQFPRVSLFICFVNDKLLLNTKERYRHEILHAIMPYQSYLYGDNISKEYIHPFQNGGYKNTFRKQSLKLS